ncbi:MAG: 4Fe-4S cluster-binding domain-containing protein [bacterium]|nr:4Fe-4S cluster-binding domain-containing protein [bacterium]
MNISYLHSGGLITNYYCSSSCKHCLYCSSPTWDKEYIDEKTAESLFEKSASLGCDSLHIGGGEPMLDFPGLIKILKVAERTGIRIEYVETNSSWYKNHEQAKAMLKELPKLSVQTLLISISPFHNEYIPFYKVKGVIEACHGTGLSVMPWIKDFYGDLDSFDDKQTHSLSEYMEAFGPGYLKNVFSRYWVHPGGRALTAFPDLYGKKSTEALTSHCSGCNELTNTSHFHFDLYGNYVPGLCSGIRIDHRDIGYSLPEKEYPYLYLLFNKGIKGFFKKAVTLGFAPKKAYVSKCHLCLNIRRFLVMEKKLEPKEFGPRNYYKEVPT